MLQNFHLLAPTNQNLNSASTEFLNQNCINKNVGVTISKTRFLDTQQKKEFRYYLNMSIVLNFSVEINGKSKIIRNLSLGSRY